MSSYVYDLQLCVLPASVTWKWNGKGLSKGCSDVSKSRHHCLRPRWTQLGTVRDPKEVLGRWERGDSRSALQTSDESYQSPVFPMDLSVSGLVACEHGPVEVLAGFRPCHRTQGDL